MVDELRLQRLLRSISDDLSFLSIEAAAGPNRREDPMWLRGVKYTFVTAVEACLDIAQHICSSEGWGPPQDNGDAMALLGQHTVLEPDQADAMRRAVGFRNVLVHEYIAVDDAVVVSRLADLSDIEAFVRAVSGYLS